MCEEEGYVLLSFLRSRLTLDQCDYLIAHRRGYHFSDILNIWKKGKCFSYHNGRLQSSWTCKIIVEACISSSYPGRLWGMAKSSKVLAQAFGGFVSLLTFSVLWKAMLEKVVLSKNARLWNIWSQSFTSLVMKHTQQIEFCWVIADGHYSLLTSLWATAKRSK